MIMRTKLIYFITSDTKSMPWCVYLMVSYRYDFIKLVLTSAYITWYESFPCAISWNAYNYIVPWCSSMFWGITDCFKLKNLDIPISWAGNLKWGGFFSFSINRFHRCGAPIELSRNSGKLWQGHMRCSMLLNTKSSIFWPMLLTPHCGILTYQ